MAWQRPSAALEESRNQVAAGLKRQVEVESKRRVERLVAAVLSLERSEQGSEEVAPLFLEPVAAHQRQELLAERLRQEVEEYQHLVAWE